MIIYKSRIQCPNCEGCGKMVKPFKNKDDKREIKVTVCEICNGNGFIRGNIKVLINECEKE